MSVTFFPQPSHLSGGEGLDTVQFSWMRGSPAYQPSALFVLSYG